MESSADFENGNKISCYRKCRKGDGDGTNMWTAEKGNDRRLKKLA